jgi:rfaE bifunctional protein nucleotidyltransferase chain/domain
MEASNAIVASLLKNFVPDYNLLADISRAMKGTGKRVVVTIGTYDLVHPGHARYLATAKSHGDILIVGIDSDRATKIYKGPNRPVTTEAARLEMLLHLRWPDYVTIVDDIDESTKRWGYGLIKAVSPDVFVAVEDSYPEDQLAEIRELCGELMVLPRQSSDSTSEQIRRAAMQQNTPAIEAVIRLLERVKEGEDITELTLRSFV